MAIYHLEAKMVSRGAGRSAVAAAAYLSCSRLLNEYDGVQHDYTRKQGLVWQQVFLPVAAPTEWQNREILWNAVEENEKTKDSRLAREFVVALPIELSKAQWERLLSDFVSDTFVSDGMCADVAIHDPYPPGHNPHAHILLTVRPLNEKGKWQYKTEKEYLCVKNGKEQGFTAAEFKQAQADGWEKQYQYKVGKKKVYMVPSSAQAQGYERVSKYPKSTKYGRQNPISERWNSEEQLVFWRKAWADVTNLHLERAGQEERIDQRSHAERGLDEQPTIHEGVTARALEKKGIVSDRCELNRQIKADNALLRELKAAVKKLMQVVKVAVPALAEAMEFLRANMIVFRYQIRYAGLGKHKLSERLNVLKPTLERYTLLVQQIKNKAKERKTLLAEKKATPFYQFVVHNDLEKKIAKLTEDLEELKSEKVMVLSSLGCDEDTGIAEVRKSVAAMERNLERLTQQEEKYVAELDTALIQFTELKEQEKEVDYIALFEQLNILALQYPDSGKLSTDVPDVDTGIDWLVYLARYSQQCQAQSHFVVRSRLDIVENTEIMVGPNQSFYCGTLRPDCRPFRTGIFKQRAVLRPDTIQAVTSKLKMAYGEKFAPIILADSKRDVAELLGEETEVRSIHEDLQKKHEQEVECKNTPKKNGQER